MRSELVVQQLHRDMTLAQGREKAGRDAAREGTRCIQRGKRGWAKFRPIFLPCMIHDKSNPQQSNCIDGECWACSLVGQHVSQRTAHGQSRDPGVLQPHAEGPNGLPQLIHQPASDSAALVYVWGAV